MHESENPFASPVASSVEPPSWPPPFDPARLTPLQQHVLSAYCHWHEHPPKLGSLVRAAWKNWLTLFALTAALVAGLRYFERDGAAMFVLGLTGGIMLRDYVLSSLNVVIWPMLDALMDWPRVEQLRRDAGLSDPRVSDATATCTARDAAR